MSPLLALEARQKPSSTFLLRTRRSLESAGVASSPLLALVSINVSHGTSAGTGDHTTAAEHKRSAHRWQESQCENTRVETESDRERKTHIYKGLL